MPAIGQEEYYIEVFSSVGHTNDYDLEIENFAAPVPSGIHLDPASDTGMSSMDEKTADTTPRFLIQTDLLTFLDHDRDGGIENNLTEPQILTPSVVDPTDLQDGAGFAVEVVITNSETGNVAQGFATPLPSATSPSIFEFTSNTPLTDGVYFVASRIQVVDGQDTDPNQLGVQPGQIDVTGRSHPIWVTIDTTAPVASTPDLLDSSDTGMSSIDNVTNKMQPAFSGLAEEHVKVRILAENVTNGASQLIGSGVVGGDLSDQIADGNGVWEITTEPLRDAVYDIRVELEDLAGNISIGPPIRIEVDSIEPNLPFLDLAEASDSGRHNDDNITNDNTPSVTMTTHDENVDLHQILFSDNFKFRIYDRFETAEEYLLYTSTEDMPVFDLNNPADVFTALEFITEPLPVQFVGIHGAAAVAESFGAVTAAGVLSDGIHNLKLEVEDRAGNISHDFLLNILIDTQAFNGSANLHPDSDTGVWGFDATLADSITADATPTFFGAAEADNLVSVAIDGNQAGTTVAVPLDGDDAFQPPGDPNIDGNWQLTSTQRLADGEHVATFTYEDVAGNRATSTVSFFVDTTGPYITNVTQSNDDRTSLFAPKPSAGPDPLIESIIVRFEDLPQRVFNFNYEAVLRELAEEEGNYRLVGDANGNIPIVSASVMENEDGPNAVGDPAITAFSEVKLTFAFPLPDDRYTLTVFDRISDPAGNALDGESQAAAPFEGTDGDNGPPPVFPTGDGNHGGDFFARFTVDSRPELGVWAASSVWVDTNGNFEFDPTNTDHVNRDIIYSLAFTSDDIFVGNFVTGANDTTDGFDKLAAYGWIDEAYRWLIDVDNDGVPDLPASGPDPLGINGHPFAGDFDNNPNNGDEVGFLADGVWWFDTDHDFRVDDDLPTTMVGEPVIGDFDGDGIDDLAVWADDVFHIDTNRNGNANHSFRFGFIGVRELPIAADMNQDGIDDIGLWVPDREGVPPTEGSEWYLLLSDDGQSIIDRIEPAVDPIDAQPVVNFTPVPFGNDIYAQFGDQFALPIIGNFDPPVTQTSGGVISGVARTNPTNALDVDGNGVVTPFDALHVINYLNGVSIPILSSGPFLDVTNDGSISPFDALLVINELNDATNSDIDAPANAVAAMAKVASAVDRVFAHDQPVRNKTATQPTKTAEILAHDELRVELWFAMNEEDRLPKTFGGTPEEDHVFDPFEENLLNEQQTG